MTERVDKSWNSKGLETYSLEAIFGTLQHYGAGTLDEAAYTALAKEDFPLTIAARWHEHWKGTGQFSRFPAAASEELWRRLCAPQIAPTDVALALVKLVTALGEAAQGKADDGTWDSRFKVVEAYLPAFPGAERREKFVSELMAAMGEWMEAFDTLTERLAEAKLFEHAERLVKLEEGIFPLRGGVASALYRGLRGEKTEALAELSALAGDVARNDYARLAAVDALLELGELVGSQAALLALVDKAEQTRDLELASASVELLTELLHRTLPRSEQLAIRARVDALSKAFGAAEDAPA